MKIKFKTIILLLASLFFFIGCQKTKEAKVEGTSENTEEAPSLAGLPKKVKIIREGGITAREMVDKQSAVLGSTPKGYEYEVIEGFAAYYQIKFLDGKIGWISANPAENWTTLTSPNQVKITHTSGITVRTEPNKEAEVLGAAASGYTFELLAAEYIYLKVKLPEGKEGWIYIGKPNEPWVEYLN